MRPCVLCFSGLDPSGGAGLQADIEAIGAQGAHAAVVCTALTVQNSQRVAGFLPTPSDFLQQSALHLVNDLPIRAVKSGMMGSTDNICTLKHLLKTHFAHVPYVLDPVLVANSGDSLGDVDTLVEAFLQLLPYATLVTPNTHEARALSGCHNLHKAAKNLCKAGAKAVLIKTSHDFDSGNIEQFLYIDGVHVHTSTLKRLPYEYHGSGCTLASALAARLALGEALTQAVKNADAFVWQTLATADAPHQAQDTQRIPRRFLGK